MPTSASGRRRTGLLAILGASTCALLVGIGGVALDARDAAAKADAALAAVTNPDGSPKKGYDPARKPQRPLTAAAAKAPPLPAQAKVDGSVGLNPGAKGVNSGKKKQVATGRPAPKAKPGDVLTRSTATGGCRPEYGTRGECLPYIPPSHAAHPDHSMDHAWTCAELRTLLPEGIPLRDPTIDPLRLDTDGDGTACGRGDA